MINESNKLRVTKDNNEIAITDQYGNDVLSARYLNSRAFRLDGLLFYRGVPIRLSQPLPRGNIITGACNRDSTTDIDISMPLGNNK